MTTSGLSCGLQRAEGALQPGPLLQHSTNVSDAPMNRTVRSPAKSPRFSGPPKVRHEPPTIEEAVFAAQALASDVEQQVAIVAGLMYMPEEQVRPHVLDARPGPAFSRPARDGVQSARSPPVVVVRRRRLGPE